MIQGLQSSREECRSELGALAIDIRVRVLNCGSSGCLVESARPLTVGTVAKLRLSFTSGDFEDTVQVVRCQQIVGAGVFHVGTEFLTTSPPSGESLRFLIRRETGQVGAWLGAGSTR